MLNFLTAAAPELFFEPANFVQNLRYMGIGMLVIFVIIGVIILATTLVGYLFSDEKQ
ncbi:MAG: hypothetical protein Q4B75_09100 [Eubacteriales bacterium]|nr:hypothetical protein [Eubacteriales bacterium]